MFESRSTQVHSGIPAALPTEALLDKLLLLEEKVADSSQVERKLIDELERLVAQMQANAQKMTEMETLVAKTISEKLEMLNLLEAATKRIAELETRVAAVEKECQEWWPPNTAWATGWTTSSSSMR